MKRWGLIALFLALAMLAPAPLRAADTPAAPVATPDPSGAASAVVQNFYGTLTDTMKAGPKLGFAGRYKKLEPVMQAAFNLPLMTRVAVGPAWIKATPGEQQQLISAFSNFSVANYASQFKAWDGEQFSIADEKPSADGGILVETNLKPKGGDPVALNYLMRLDDEGRWRIVDVYFAGAISQIAARRAEFDAITQKDGIPALVNSLDQKSKQMGPS